MLLFKELFTELVNTAVKTRITIRKRTNVYFEVTLKPFFANVQLLLKLYTMDDEETKPDAGTCGFRLVR